MLIPIAAVAVSIGFALLAWQVNRAPFDLDLLKMLEPGMSQAAVRQKLGEPDSIYPDSWSYSRFLAWPIVYIRFDENGQFRESEYDF